MNKNMLFVRAAFFLVLLLVSQSLRFVLPLPPFISMFVIGTSLNAILLMSSFETNFKLTATIATIAPIVAFMQGMLPLPVFIPVIAAGNLAYIVVVVLTKRQKQIITALTAPIIKTLTLFAGLHIVLAFFILPEKIATAMSFALSWSQLITGFCGALLGFFLLARIGTKKNNY